MFFLCKDADGKYAGENAWKWRRFQLYLNAPYDQIGGGEKKTVNRASPSVT